MAKLGRAVAPDLYGFGKSDKPSGPTSYHEHAELAAGFIEALGLRDIILIIMDFGSPMGFQYTHDHPTNVRAIAFWETLVRPNAPETAEFSTRLLLEVLHTAAGGRFLLQRINFGINVS
jgi:haloalkane dehalogenase